MVSSKRGFTLVEVLVAVALFALLSAGIWTALGGLSAAASVHRDRSESFRSLQLAVAGLDADLRQLSHRAVRAPTGTELPAFAGHAAGFEATRAGWSNPAELARGELQRFGWQIRDGELIRLDWPVLDRVHGVTPRQIPRVDGVAEFRLRFRDPHGTWHDHWPAGPEPAALPAAVEYELESGEYGLIRRLVVLD